MKEAFCPACGTALKESSNFCPYCGKRLGGGASERMPVKHVLVILAASLGIFTFAWNLKASLAGQAPTRHFQGEAPAASAPPPADDPALKELREAAKADPKNVTAWVTFAQALTARIRASSPPHPGTVFDAIDTLRHVLDLDPNNAYALIAMADLSFEQQAFSKAAQFYEKYLKAQPDDVSARARYASTLSLMNENQRALQELETALKKDPENFHANAYSAVTYAQLGEYEKAKERGEKAMKVAPSEEARRRFGEFLENLGKETKRGNMPEKSPELKGLPSDAAAIEKAIRENQVAGPKFSRAAVEGGTLKLYFNNFPMSQMPPFVRDKFLGKIKDAARDAKSFSEIVFLEENGGAELERLKLR